MKIEHVPFSKVEMTDTDKLPDVDAMILEKSEELRQLCLNSKRQCVILVDDHGKEDGTATAFWNLSMNSSKNFEDAVEINKAFDNMLTFTNTFIIRITNGQYQIANRHIEPPQI